jgi:CubicO group peptidase (beta-lactamase class C family)
MHKRITVLILITVLFAQHVLCQAAGDPFDSKAIDSVAAKIMAEYKIVGVSAAVMHKGVVKLAKTYGKRSLETGEAVEPTTQFAVGSVTKQFTCACIFLLQEDGKLSVHDKVAKYFPGLTRANDITLLDLMNHVSGYPDYYPLDFVDRRMMKPITPDDLIKEYAGGKLDFEPGSLWSYSNTGYIILGRVVEKITGEKFATFLERRIIKPLGLANTSFEPTPQGKAFARGYTTFAFGAPEPAVYEANGWIYSAGGVWSTASDLAKWDLALMDGRVLKPESFKLMTAARILSNGRSANYACGLGVGMRNGFTVHSHGGAVSGFLAQNMFIPAMKAAVVVLVNSDYAGDHIGELQNKLSSMILAADPSLKPFVPTIAGLPASEAAKRFLKSLMAGSVDRRQLGEEYSIFLTDEKIQRALAKLKEYGEPEKIQTDNPSERGGMEVTVTRFDFKTGTFKALMYRTPDGKIQEFLVF